MRKSGWVVVNGAGIAAALLVVSSDGTNAAPPAQITLAPVGVYRTFLFDQGAAEISTYDPATRRLFTTTAALARLDMIDISDPANPAAAGFIDLSPYGHHANSVAVRGDLLVVAVEAALRSDSGQLVFFTTAGNFLRAVTVGAVPDMVRFSPDGRLVLLAIEGEPNDPYTVDPEGAVVVVDVSGGSAGIANAAVTTIDFRAFNGTTLDPTIRIFGPNATVAQDLEPEYLTVSSDSKTAWVTLQENNAFGIIDLVGKRVTKLVGLGYKDHSVAGQGLDASDQDNAIDIKTWPVLGMYLPDTIASYEVRGRTILVTANEGDLREWPGINASGTEARRASTLTLDPTAFPTFGLLQANTALGRLNVAGNRGDTDGDGDFDKLYSYGARSFTLWTDQGKLLWDSGDAFEQMTATTYPQNFNASNTNNTRDNRSDDKGPEPEGLTVATLFGRTFVFVGLERTGGIVVYDVTATTTPTFVQYISTRDFSAAPNSAAAGDLAPEGMFVIEATDSPTKQPLLVTSNEVSGTVRIFSITRK